MFNISPKKEDNILIYAIKGLVHRYIVDKLSQVGGQLAYFCILSIFPFFIVVNAMIARLHLPISRRLIEAKEFLPPDIFSIISEYLSYISNSTDGNVLSIGLLFTLYLASRASLSLIEAINKAYRTEVHPPFWKKIAVSLLITITLGVTIILSLLFLTFGKKLTMKTLSFLHYPLNYIYTWNIIRWSFVILALTLSLSLIYYLIPYRKAHLRSIVPGTIFSIVSFLAMSIAFSIYVNNYNNYTAIYGSLGGIIAFMIWLYSSGIIIVLGAELNHILQCRKLKIYKYDVVNEGSLFVPKPKIKDGIKKIVTKFFKFSRLK